MKKSIYKPNAIKELLPLHEFKFAGKKVIGCHLLNLYKLIPGIHGTYKNWVNEFLSEFKENEDFIVHVNKKHIATVDMAFKIANNNRRTYPLAKKQEILEYLQSNQKSNAISCVLPRTESKYKRLNWISSEVERLLALSNTPTWPYVL